MDTSQSETGQGSRVVEISSRERRIHPRSNCWGNAWIGIYPEGIKTVVYVIDLGLGGCCVDADVAIPASPNSHVEVFLKVGNSTLQVAGIIRHLEGETRAGIEFADVSPRKGRQISRLMAAIVDSEKQRLAGVEPLGG